MKHYSVQEMNHIGMIFFEAGFKGWTEKAMEAVNRMYSPNAYCMAIIQNKMQNLQTDCSWLYR